MLRDLRADERGMTLIELMVAMMICIVGVMSTLAVIDRSREANTTSEAREVIAHQAERALERTLATPWDEIGHTVAPTRSATVGDPANYVTTSAPAGYKFDWQNTARSEEFNILAGGTVPSAPTTWTDYQNRMSGTVHRFVTYAGQKARRVTVVATANPPVQVQPVLVSSLVTNPEG